MGKSRKTRRQAIRPSGVKAPDSCAKSAASAATIPTRARSAEVSAGRTAATYLPDGTDSAHPVRVYADGTASSNVWVWPINSLPNFISARRGIFADYVFALKLRPPWGFGLLCCVQQRTAGLFLTGPLSDFPCLLHSTGIFDMFHFGHARALEQAKKL